LLKDNRPPSRPDLGISETHIKKKEVSSWEEMRDEILKDHESLSERRKRRDGIET
jgi:hypothetical protein